MRKKQLLLLIFLNLLISLNILILVNQKNDLVSIAAYEQLDLAELGQISTGGMALHVQIVDNLAIVADGFTGLVLIDVSNPTNPSQISTLHDGTGSPTDICVIDEYVYVADGTDGLEIIDISNPTTPEKIGNFSDGGYANGVSVFEHYALIADMEDGLEVIDVSDPVNPTKVAEYYLSGSYKDIVIIDEVGFITNNVIPEGRVEYSDLTIVDLSDVNNITRIGSIKPGYGNAFITSFVSEGRGYFSIHGVNMQIKVVDTQDVGDFNEVGNYYFQSGEVPNKGDVSNNILSVATGAGGLTVYDVSEVLTPIKVGNYFDGGYAYDVQIEGNLAYIADRQDGLEIIQLFNIQNGSTTTSAASAPGITILTTIIGLFSIFVIWRYSTNKYKD